MRILFFITVLFLTGCEKSVDFKLNEIPPKLVVEAVIENNEKPVVILTTSVNYFSKINPDLLSKSFVRKAIVTMSNGIVTHTLKEDSLRFRGGYYLYYYSIDSNNLATAFKGELNRKYQLRVNYNGQEYNATTTIPEITKRIDSIGWKSAIGTDDSTLVALYVKVTDRPGYGDYIRYSTKRNSEPFFPPFNSVFDDQVIDGATYEVEVERGQERNGPVPEDYSFFNKGDSVVFKLCNIDKATYDFWRTMEYSYSTIGNPFSTPTQVISNISNNALGYFGGYACQYKTIIIPR